MTEKQTPTELLKEIEKVDKKERAAIMQAQMTVLPQAFIDAMASKGKEKK